ncbi:MAG: sulfite exporter TauE/SafE family protein [Verrucomicrobiales bacterium]
MIALTEMTSLAALAAGLATSPHCLAMCGPLACAVTSRSKTNEHAQLEALGYHLGRLLSYTTIGALAGLIGKQPLAYFFDSPAVILPWLMIPFLLISAFPRLLKLPRLPLPTKTLFRLRLKAQKSPPGISGGLLGLLSPALPCAPLYLIFGICLLSGSAPTGARLALCFTLGTIPLLWLAQSTGRLLIRHIPPRWRHGLRIAFLLTLTLLLTFRLQDTLSAAEAPAPLPENTDHPATLTDQARETTTGLPSCCQEP